MNLRTKTIYIIALIMLFLILTLSVIMKMVILKSFSELEEKILIENIQRAVNKLNADIDMIHSINTDWAAWDDTYRFIQDNNQEYIDANLVMETFVYNRFNFMLYINENNEIVFSRGYNITGLPELNTYNELKSYLTSSISKESMNENVEGILMLPSGAVILSSHPIVTSKHLGPSRGRLVSGRFLDAEELEQISVNVKLSLSLVRVDPTMENLSHYDSTLIEVPIFINYISQNEIEGRVLLNSIEGAPALKMLVHMEREVYNEGIRSLQFLIGSLIIASMIFAIVSILLLEKVIISRILGLVRNVINVGKSNDLTSRVPITSDDELSHLESEFNKMMQSLDQSQLRIKHLAYHDSLTDLPNRVMFTEHLQRVVSVAEATNQMVAVIFIDLDKFKEINDSLGHVYGDTLLKTVADVLRNTVREDDLIARLGGDEFTVILNDLSSIQEVRERAGRILSELVSPFHILGHEISVSASLGISIYPQDGDTGELLVRKADQAMYVAKGIGGGCYEFYQPHREDSFFK